MPPARGLERLAKVRRVEFGIWSARSAFGDVHGRLPAGVRIWQQLIAPGVTAEDYRQPDPASGLVGWPVSWKMEPSISAWKVAWSASVMVTTPDTG